MVQWQAYDQSDELPGSITRNFLISLITVRCFYGRLYSTELLNLVSLI
jgi:hypothetical protein